MRDLRPRLPLTHRLRLVVTPVVLLGALAATATARYVAPDLPLLPAAVRLPAATPAGSMAGAGSMNVVTLPIEVLGADGRTEGVVLNVASPAGVDSLYLVGHALGYHNSPRLWNGQVQRDGKASYRINGGPWRPISNANARVRWPERAYLGIGGAYHTVRLTVPVSGVQAGANTVEFRFNGTEGVGTGFRILELDLRAGTQSRISGTQFVQDDPETWQAPSGYDNAAAVQAGGVLWAQRNRLRESPLPGARTLVAACSDCHAPDGLDLKYFNFSNRSVVARSQFHGMTEAEGNQIAAYIRARNLGRADGRATAPRARPWNPPLQPGPGLSKNAGGRADDWFAGAGLEWVLDRDAETARYAFDLNNDNVVSPAEVADALRPDRPVPLEQHDIPIAIQLPDWNGWLPDVHPFDAAGRADVEGTALYQHFLTMEGRLAAFRSGDPTNATGKFRSWITCRWFGATGMGCGNSGFAEIFMGLDDSGDGGAIKPLFDVSYAADPATYLLAETSILQWQAVQSWALMQRHRLFDLGPTLFGGLTVNAPAHPRHGQPVLARTDVFFMPTTQSVIFNIAPHKTDHAWPSASSYGPPGTQVLSYYFSTAWYHLQLLAGGDIARYTSESGGAPIDWGYQQPLLFDTQRTAGVSHYVRGVLTQGFAWQTRFNDYHTQTWRPNSFGDKAGFEPVSTHPRHLFGRYANPNSPVNWNGELEPNGPLARRLLEGSMAAYVGFLLREPDGAWNRGAPTDASLGNPYEPVTYTPQVNTSGPRFADYSWANGFFGMPGLMRNWGMRPTLVDSLARWGERMWPLANWEQWFVAAPPAFESQAVPLQAGWNLVSTHVAPADSALTAVLGAALPHVVLVRDQQGAVFVPEFGVNEIGPWRRGRAYQVFVSQATSFTVTGPPLVPQATPITLAAGWGQVAYLRRTPMALGTALASIADRLVLVRDGNGNVYLPSEGIDQIGLLRPGQGYKVYVNAATTLVYPADAAAVAPHQEGAVVAQGGGFGTGATLVLAAPASMEGHRIRVSTAAGLVVGEAPVTAGRAVVALRGHDPMAEGAPGAVAGDPLVVEVVGPDGEVAAGDALGGVRDVLTGERRDGVLHFQPDGAWVADVRGSSYSFTLGQSFPSPFRTTVTIPYVLPRSTYVEVQIFDAVGRRIATLVEEQQEAGPHQAVFTADALPSGVYFLRIRAGADEARQSLVLVR